MNEGYIPAFYAMLPITASLLQSNIECSQEHCLFNIQESINAQVGTSLELVFLCFLLAFLQLYNLQFEYS